MINIIDCDAHLVEPGMQIILGKLIYDVLAVEPAKKNSLIRFSIKHNEDKFSLCIFKEEKVTVLLK
jgi:hypothetical protein